MPYDDDCEVAVGDEVGDDEVARNAGEVDDDDTAQKVAYKLPKSCPLSEKFF